MPELHQLEQPVCFARCGTLSFVTDLSQRRDGPRPGRVCVPFSDPEARAVYYCACLARQRKFLDPLFRRLEAQTLEPSE